MTAPYRTPAPPAEPRPSLWQRAVFAAWPELAAEVWQWARKRMGGRWSMAPHRQPGWVRVPERLVWLEWWVRWALDNCTIPVIANT